MDVSSDPVGDATASGGEAFEAWFSANEPSLRAALVAEFGPELGRDAAAEALSYVWEHRGRVLELDKPVGYAFRVGQRWARRQRARWRRRFPMPSTQRQSPGFEPRLHEALAGLSIRQRQVVVLCVGYGLTHAEAAEVLDLSRSTIQNHAERGLRNLQKAIGS